ncbi:MAG: ABC transporter permease [Promethearchaeota archaeon]
MTIKENFKRFFKKLSAHRQQLITVSLLLAIILIVFISSIIYSNPFKKYYTMIGDRELPLIFDPPSLKHLLGTNDFGNDNLVVLIHATRNSIILGFAVGGISVGIAVFIGVVGSYVGGILDEIFQFITNIALVFPIIPFILLLSTMLNQRSIIIIGIIIALFNWPWAARTIRAQVLSLKERNFIKVSKVTGMRNIKIAIFEILPNLFSYIMLVFVIIVGIAITVEAGISIIGLGQEEILTLGMMLYWSKEFGHVTGGFYNLWLPPGIVLTLFLVLIYTVHSSMVEIFNPRLREK